jgi:hypothetical protein
MEARLTYCDVQSHYREVLGHLADFAEIKEIHKEDRNPAGARKD